MSRRSTGRALAALLATTVACAVLAPLPALAADVDDYRQRVSEAESLVAEAMDDLDEQAAVDELVSELRVLLPRDEVITRGGEEVGLADETVAEAMDDLEAATTAGARVDIATSLGDRLASIHVALGEPADRTLASDPEALARIMDEERIADEERPSWLQDLIDRIEAWLESLSIEAPDMPEPVYKWILPTMSALAVLVAAWIVVRLWRRGVARRDRVSTLDDAESGLPIVAVAEGLPEDVLSFADRTAAAGLHRDAVRALFGGAARELGERGVLARTRTRTTGELLRDVTRARASLGVPLAELAGVFEPAWYGHRDPGDGGFGVARSAYVNFLALLEAGGES